MIEGIDLDKLHGPRRGSYPAHYFYDEVSWSPSRSRFAIAYTICEASMCNDVGCVAWGIRERKHAILKENPRDLRICCWNTPFARWISETKFLIRTQIRIATRLLLPVIVIDTDGEFAVVPETHIADCFLDVTVPTNLTFHKYSEMRLIEEIENSAE